MLIYQASIFATDKDGAHVKLQRLHRTGNTDRMKLRLDNLTVQARNSLQKQLTIDFIYMPFMYLMMICLSLFVVRITCSCSPWTPVLWWLCWIPFAIWIFDLLENLLMRLVFRHYDTGQPLVALPIWMMAASNLLKWSIAAAWIILHLSHVIAWLVTQGN